MTTSVGLMKELERLARLQETFTYIYQLIIKYIPKDIDEQPEGRDA